MIFFFIHTYNLSILYLYFLITSVSLLLDFLINIQSDYVIPTSRLNIHLLYVNIIIRGCAE